jgi:altronate hydrolase
MKINALRLNETDNVLIALLPLLAGDTSSPGVTTAEDIGAGHKFAARDIKQGEQIVKYGQVIGVATADIAIGCLVHSHNLAMGDARLGAGETTSPTLPRPARDTFIGYRRKNGRVGTRNYIGIVSTVNCSATVCRAIAEAATRTLLPKYPGIDGFAPIVHDQGCGMVNHGEGYDILVRTLAGYRDHANFGGVLLVGLGCEVNQLSAYGEIEDPEHAARYASFNIQSAAGSSSAVRKAVEILDGIAKIVSQDQRETCPASELILGMQCGGSDGFSGLSANPALGVASDLLVAAGGTSLLSETPEIFGAEHLLIARSDAQTGARIADMIEWWKDYAEKNNATLDNNPSPGNKRGGLTTILEKSLGAVAKSGRAPVSDAIGYAWPVRKHGLVYMDSPGYDPVSATGQVASGANIIAFTTGRGSCFGAKPAPSLKLASSSTLFARMPEDMDIDCGTVITGLQTHEELGLQIYNTILDTASGAKTKSEDFGYGDNEFVPWKIGAVL